MGGWSRTVFKYSKWQSGGGKPAWLPRRGEMDRRVVPAIAIFESSAAQIQYSVESGGEQRCCVVAAQDGIRTRDSRCCIWFLTSSYAQDRHNHGHKKAGGYPLATDIADDDRQPICIQHEVVVEVATDLASWTNFGPDLKIAVSQVQRRFFRQERLLNQSGASHFLLLPLLGKDLVSKAAECSGVLGELRRGVC